MGKQREAFRDRPQCVHCGRRPQNRPRKLCSSCFYRVEVRVLYPAREMNAATPVLGGRKPDRLPEVPTSAPPGTTEKMNVFTARLERGEELYHPDDAPMDDGL